MSFTNNTVTFNVSVVAPATIRAIASFNGSKGTATVSGNTITLSGAMPAGSAVHGIEVSGNNTNIVNVTQNVINGGNVDPPTAASHDSHGLEIAPTGLGLPSPVVSTVNATQNVVTGFVDGVAMVDFSGTPVAANIRTFITISNNNLAGNANKAIKAANSGTTIDASGNWYGSSVFATVQAAITGSAVDFTPYLNSGTDTDGGTAGFQGDFSSLTVHTAGARTGATGRVQEGINLATSGGTVKILGGSYTGGADATGNSVTLSPGASPAQVNITGDLILDGNDTVVFEIDGLAAGTQYDQIAVTGTVTLGGAIATIIVNPLFVPAVGSFDLVTSTWALNRTFGAVTAVSRRFVLLHRRSSGQGDLYHCGQQRDGGRHDGRQRSRPGQRGLYRYARVGCFERHRAELHARWHGQHGPDRQHGLHAAVRHGNDSRRQHDGERHDCGLARHHRGGR